MGEGRGIQSERGKKGMNGGRKGNEEGTGKEGE